jgi:hypothetical protein
LDFKYSKTGGVKNHAAGFMSIASSGNPQREQASFSAGLFPIFWKIG